MFTVITYYGDKQVASTENISPDDLLWIIESEEITTKENPMFSFSVGVTRP